LTRRSLFSGLSSELVSEFPFSPLSDTTLMDQRSPNSSSTNLVTENQRSSSFLEVTLDVVLLENTLLGLSSISVFEQSSLLLSPICTNIF